MPRHDWAVVRIANLYTDMGYNVLAHHFNYDHPDTICGHKPDVYVRTIRRLYQVKNNISDFKKMSALDQYRAYKKYPNASSFYIVLCERMNNSDKHECYSILKSNRINGFKVLGWDEALEKIEYQ